MGITLRIVRSVTLLSCGLLLWNCSKPPDDEQLIRQSMQAIQTAAEAKAIGEILEYLADDFIGNRQLRKANIRGMLLLHFRQNQNVHAFLHSVEVTVNGNKADVTCQVILAGRGEEIIPERARVLDIQSKWEKRNDRWQIVEASWQDPYYPL